jgi:hypothetical protein
MNTAAEQLLSLVILGIPVATVTWTVTHEEVFREMREWCLRKSKTCSRLYERKFFYLLTCEYCLSHYVAALFLALAGFQLLLPGWRGYLLAWFALVWLANVYMSLYGRLRLDIRHERLEIETTQNAAEGLPEPQPDPPQNKGVAPIATKPSLEGQSVNPTIGRATRPRRVPREIKAPQT